MSSSAIWRSLSRISTPLTLATTLSLGFGAGAASPAVCACDEESFVQPAASGRIRSAAIAVNVTGRKRGAVDIGAKPWFFGIKAVLGGGQEGGPGSKPAESAAKAPERLLNRPLFALNRPSFAMVE